MSRVEIDAGVLEGIDEHEGRVQTFRGIPYAAPPVGDLRWSPPQPVAPWSGVLPAAEFGPRCTQNRIFLDMVFRDEIAEDCLYLNVWTPAHAADERLPVMVWIHGGGFVAGSASEPRQDGGRLAQERVVVVGINYRLAVFGFLAHPELTAESAAGASGNQGLLDQIAALHWVRRNIAAFGGDPGNVTIFGESAGSFAVSALMASPLAEGLFHRAIGESGAFFESPHLANAPPDLAQGDASGARFVAHAGAASLASLRARPADEVLKAAFESGQRFAPIVDGHVLPRCPLDVFGAGEQAAVPLLAGWNLDEMRALETLAKPRTGAVGFAERVRETFGDAAGRVLAVYPNGSDEEALESAAALRGDLFVGHSSWKWLELHAASGAPTYRFSFDRKIPIPADGWNGTPATAADVGARHAGEIDYVFGSLDYQATVPWEPADRALSELMRAYWANFARVGDPNRAGLPEWPTYGARGRHRLMHLDVRSEARPDVLRARYEVLDALVS